MVESSGATLSQCATGNGNLAAISHSEFPKIGVLFGSLCKREYDVVVAPGQYSNPRFGKLPC